MMGLSGSGICPELQRCHSTGLSLNPFPATFTFIESTRMSDNTKKQPIVFPARERFADAIARYDAANPMRTADQHGDDCRCERCLIDDMRAIIDDFDASIAAASRSVATSDFETQATHAGFARLECHENMQVLSFIEAREIDGVYGPCIITRSDPSVQRIMLQGPLSDTEEGWSAAYAVLSSIDLAEFANIFKEFKAPA